MPRKRETGGVRKRGRVWWIYYRVDGKRYDESTGQGDERIARSMLAQRRQQIREGTWQPISERKAHTVDAYAEARIEQRTAAEVRNVHDEGVWLRKWLLPELGSKALTDVTRADIVGVVSTMKAAKSKQTGRPYAPRTILHCYNTIRLLFDDAVVAGLIAATPCTLKTKRGELPQKRDADPRWRSQAVYTRSEAETLISHERIPHDRRVYYALQLLAGLRSGETAARRWSDLDTEAEPMGRMLVWNQVVDGKERATKTGDVRDVPIHPTLAAILADWKLSGFAFYFGRHPGPDDLVIPSRRGPATPRTDTMLVKLKDDLKRLGLRHEGRARHAMRATFLTLLETDGANMSIAARATHKSQVGVGGAVGGYLRSGWPALCAEVGKLNLTTRRGDVIALPKVAVVGAGDSFGDSEGATKAETPLFAGSRWSGRLDLNQRPPHPQ
jgi:integrase